jgi:surface antigen
MSISNREVRIISLATVFLTLLLTGNTSSANGHNQAMGIVIGAATGGFLGSQIGGDGHYDRHRYDRGHNNRRYDAPGYKYRSKHSRRYDYPRYYSRNYYSPRYDYPRYYTRNYYSWRYDYPRYYNRNYYNYRRHDDSVQLIATATGVFFGALIGSEIGRYMDDVDQMRAREANLMAQTAPIGSQITWNNPQSYNSGSVTATRDGYSESGKYCREFYQTVSIGGKTENAYGVACRQPDGSWQIVQSIQ